MNKYLPVIKSDMKNTFRDPSLIIILCVPLLIIMVLRFGFPYLSEYLPQVVDYKKEVVSFFALITAFLPAMVMSFILLDEKDMQLFPVMKVTPVSLSGFILTRLVFMIIVGFITSMAVLLLNGIYLISLQDAFQTALLSGLHAPILVLLISYFAKNKIEGMTLMKVATVTLFVPMAVFFIDTRWEYALCVFPAFWVYAFFDAGNSVLLFCIGLICLIGYNRLVFRLCYS